MIRLWSFGTYMVIFKNSEINSKQILLIFSKFFLISWNLGPKFSWAWGYNFSSLIMQHWPYSLIPFNFIIRWLLNRCGYLKKTRWIIFYWFLWLNAVSTTSPSHSIHWHYAQFRSTVCYPINFFFQRVPFRVPCKNHVVGPLYERLVPSDSIVGQRIRCPYKQTHTEACNTRKQFLVWFASAALSIYFFFFLIYRFIAFGIHIIIKDTHVCNGIMPMTMNP